MISVRRHVLTIVAVFLALAVGVLLGATSVGTWLSDSVADSGGRTQDRLDTTTAELADARGDLQRLDGVAASVGPAVTAGILDKRPVLVVLAPGASAADADAALEVVRSAGGFASGRVVLTDKAVDPSADAELQTLLTNLPLAPGAPGADADLGAQLGHALATGAVLRGTDAQPLVADKDRETVLTTLKRAGLVDYQDGSVRPGQLVLMVTGGAGGTDGVVGTRLAAAARQLDRLGAGTVVATQAGRTPGDDPVSVLRAARGGVSTVDHLDSRVGRLAVTLALAEQLRGRDGSYGLRADATSAVPEVPAKS